MIFLVSGCHNRSSSTVFIGQASAGPSRRVRCSSGCRSSFGSVSFSRNSVGTDLLPTTACGYLLNPSYYRITRCQDNRRDSTQFAKRAKIIHAEGELEALAKLAEAAGVTASQPVSITLRYLQTLT
jgi:hypothetical protein